MSSVARHFRFIHISITFLSVIVLFHSLFLLVPNYIDSVEAEDIEIDMDSVPNFDVQFMIESDTDQLTPYPNKKWAKVTPGSVSFYWLMITNMGPVNDTYDISLSTPPGGLTWYFYDTKTLNVSVHLTSPHIRDVIDEGESFKIFRIAVEIPIDASSKTVFPILVMAESENLFSEIPPRNYRDKDELIISVHDISYLQLKSPYPPIYYVDPGEYITIALPVTNLGNKDFITVDVRIIEDEFWRTNYRHFEDMYIPNYYFLDFNWTGQTVVIPQGETIMLELKVRVNPEFGGEEDIFQFKIFGTIREAPNWFSTIPVSLIVNNHTTLEAEINNGNEIDILPGKEKRVDLSIINSGPSGDMIKDIYLMDPDGIKLTSYNGSGNITDRFEVPGYGTKVIEMGFIFEKELPPGKIKRQLFIRPMYDDPITKYITLNVLENIDINIISQDMFSSEMIPMGPGQEKKITIGIRNNGNTEQAVFLDLMKRIVKNGSYTPTSHDKGWSASIEWISQLREPTYMIPLLDEEQPLNTSLFEDDVGYMIEQGISNHLHPFTIEPGETVWVGMRIENPGLNNGVLIPSYPVVVVLYDEGNTILDEMDMVIDVKYPDLQFDDILRLYNEGGQQIISSGSGEEVFFNINVTNSGDWYSTRTRIDIMAGDEVIKVLWIDPLAPDHTMQLLGNFTVDSNLDSIYLEIDPNNDLIELDDQFMEGSEPNANTVRAPLSVKEYDKNNSNLIISIILFILIAAVLAAVIIFIYSRMNKISLFP